ncbi:uncharacterized protein PADG_07424 [Paracoccidioides brasiliensis Pb18]|uniref:Uncharacterized protein n=1 Tax=Paracoccidioides brasiliensis (strain Pb18) TaxID=502780 RepID=C1GJI8_PARBD|nr:uncharacterized protein PADG_07424 [Paracoccidioides brasiliensis Pb18]EEH42604.1 hypothetical protein PADG_07424 [Paracoccidioides brasiliensis Pb18]
MDPSTTREPGEDLQASLETNHTKAFKRARRISIGPTHVMGFPWTEAHAQYGVELALIWFKNSASFISACLNWVLFSLSLTMTGWTTHKRAFGVPHMLPAEAAALGSSFPTAKGASVIPKRGCIWILLTCENTRVSRPRWNHTHTVRLLPSLERIILIK